MRFSKHHFFDGAANSGVPRAHIRGRQSHQENLFPLRALVSPPLTPPHKGRGFDGSITATCASNLRENGDVTSPSLVGRG